MSNKYVWVAFYKEFANKLLGYKNNREALVEKVKQIYSITGINMPTLELDNKLIDIDPFTVFGLFNKNSMREVNRIKILSAIKNIFDLAADVPTSFGSIPVLNNQNATFYYFINDRGEHDIDDLWELFSAAIQYAISLEVNDKNILMEKFDLVIQKKGSGNSKITMGLYWIAPETFLNLDSRNEWFIFKSGKIPEDVVTQIPVVEPKISAVKYFEIVERISTYLASEKCPFNDFKELSDEAWKYSTEINEKKKLVNVQKQSKSVGAGLADEDVSTVHFWLYSPGDGACKWDDYYQRGVMGLGWHQIGDYSQYESKEEMKQAMKSQIDSSKPYVNAAHATWQFYSEMKPGDVVFVKKGLHKIVGRGVVTSDYYYDEDGLEYPNYRAVNWTHKGEWDHPGQAAMKTLTDITAYTDYVNKLNSLFDENADMDIDDETEISKYPEYNAEQFLNEVYMTGDDYDTLVELIRIKKNVILQGAPGVGKTYAAKRLAYSMMGEKNQERVMMVQFHQSYTYEDFIEGFRPSSTTNGFEIKKGSFYNFCKKAADDLDNEYFFIIDEINRGNLSKIFGELFMLIENDKRGNALQLLYSDEKFYVPANVYIIGMMNTADRSLAMLDYALRRRFAFFDMKPGFESEGFVDYQKKLNDYKFDKLIFAIQNLNSEISSDDTLGEGFCVGHSYVCNLVNLTDKKLSNIVEYEIVPLLKEYWYDEPAKVKMWMSKLRSAIE